MIWLGVGCLGLLVQCQTWITELHLAFPGLKLAVGYPPLHGCLAAVYEKKWMVSEAVMWAHLSIRIFINDRNLCWSQWQELLQVVEYHIINTSALSPPSHSIQADKMITTFIKSDHLQWRENLYAASKTGKKTNIVSLFAKILGLKEPSEVNSPKICVYLQYSEHTDWQQHGVFGTRKDFKALLWFFCYCCFCWLPYPHVPWSVL